jgi:uracil-DNA glycosylase family protein
MRSRANGAAEFVPPGADPPELAAAAQKCRGCNLYKRATQAVLGEGTSSARIVMVGELPGEREDLAGKPFVGPAGKLLDSALEDAGITRADVYITDAVKHFKSEERGKRRIHKKPSASEIEACQPWIEAELDRVQPEIIVCLGSTAARACHRQAARFAQRRRKTLRSSQGQSGNSHRASIRNSPLA